jgi:hypothetical protein
VQTKKERPLSESELKRAHELFVKIVEQLEKYIERHKNIFKWLDTIVIEGKGNHSKEYISDLENAEEHLLILLPYLHDKLKDRSSSFFKELSKE